MKEVKHGAKPERVLLAGDQLNDPEALAWFWARMNGTEPTPEAVEEFRRLMAEEREGDRRD